MDTQPLISVIVPIYNVENYLDRCVDSLVNQTYKNLEIILVDDGSPDNCPQMCENWANKDDRIMVIHKENSGAGESRNLGLLQSSGEIISFIDSDDVIHQDFYKRLISYFSDIVDVVECEFTSFSNQPHFISDIDIDVIRCNSEAALSYHINDKCFRQVIWNKLYRRSIVEGISFPVGKLIDDEFWTYRVIGKANCLVHINQALYGYRQQPDSIMHRNYSSKRLQALEAKQEQLCYISANYPDLLLLAKTNYAFACIYQGQMFLKYLYNQEKKESFKIVKSYYSKVKHRLLFRADIKISNRIWLLIADFSLLFVCRLRNKLRINVD